MRLRASVCCLDANREREAMAEKGAPSTWWNTPIALTAAKSHEHAFCLREIALLHGFRICSLQSTE